MHGSSVTRTGFASTSEVWKFSAWEYAKLRDSKVCRGRQIQLYDLRTEFKKFPLIVSKVVGHRRKDKQNGIISVSFIVIKVG
jgi:hypothetical protein